MITRIAVQAVDFDAGAELDRMNDENTGGIASFIGVVRANEGAARRIVALTLEHYPGMSERALTAIAAEAGQRWPLTGCTIIHRIGRLQPGQNIVFAAAASAHRHGALAATAFLIDWLKTQAPFWKAEEFEDGEVRWVTARAADDIAVQAWRQRGSA